MLDPNTAKPYLGVGVAQFRLGQRRSACDAFSAALCVEPTNIDAQSYLIATLMRLGEVSRAEALFAALAQQVGNPDFLNRTFGRRIIDLQDPEAVFLTTQAWSRGLPQSIAPLARQAAALQELGRIDEYKVLMAFEHFLHATRGFDAQNVSLLGPDFNATLTAAIRSSIKIDPQSGKATKQGEQTELLTPLNAPPLRSFLSALAAVASRHVRRACTAAPNHPWIVKRPQTMSIVCWGTLLDAAGHQIPHIHPSAWLSGVYYPHLPPGTVDEATRAGWIKFGRASAYTRPISVDVVYVQPTNGTLILFPSYYWHATVPTSVPGRISLAIDIVPDERGYPFAMT